jgi:mannitol-specific phosphotransferase system IIBC component
VSEEKKIAEEQDTEEQGFWAKNIISIVLIVFLIVSGVYAFNRDTEDKSVEEKVEEIKKEGEEKELNDEKSEEATEEVATENTDIQKSDTKITIKANAGDGVTHLARKAVAEYSKDKEITLSKEQKIYAETVLKNKYYKHHLNLYQELEFEISDLAETVEKAQNLSEKEIQAWSKYTHLVPSL